MKKHCLLRKKRTLRQRLQTVQSSQPRQPRRTRYHLTVSFSTIAAVVDAAAVAAADGAETAVDFAPNASARTVAERVWAETQGSSSHHPLGHQR